MRRKMRRDPNDPFAGVNEDVLGAGAGEEDIPYDRTAPVEEPPAAGAAVAPTPGAAMEEPEPGLGTEPPPGMLAGLGGPEAAPTTDQMSDVDLEGLNAPMDVGSPDDIEVDQMEAALADPNLSPQDREILQQQMALAARRRLAGMGGQL